MHDDDEFYEIFRWMSQDVALETDGSDECADSSMSETRFTRDPALTMKEDIEQDRIEQDREHYKKDVADGKAIMTKLSKEIKRRLNTWRTVPVNIAVTGHSGAGKSTFINKIRGLKLGDEGYAKTGPTQTTLEPTAYAHPRNNMLVFWDLPGFGTPEMTKENYMEKINFPIYDCFIIFTSLAFSDNDLWFAKELQKANCSVFLFARTHIDNTIDGVQHEDPNKEASAIIEECRLDIESNLAQAGIANASIFFINNFKPREYGFGKLEAHLLSHLSYYKKAQVIMTLTNMTLEVLEMKIAVLAERIKRNTTMWKVAGLIPTPFITEFVRSLVIEHEVDFYREQLGLTKIDMVKTAAEIKMEFGEMAEKLELKSHKIEFTTKEMLSDGGWKSTVVKVVPVIGTVIGAAAAVFGKNRAEEYLKNALNVLAEDAMKVAKYVTQLYAESK